MGAFTLAPGPTNAALLPLIIAEGDSLTSDEPYCWPNQIASSIPGWQIRNLASSGDSTDGVLAAYPTTIAPLYSANRPQNILVLWIGTNDLDSGAAATMAFANLEDVAEAWQTLGGAVVPVTIVPSGAQNVGEQAQRLIYNALIRTNANGYFAAVADPCALPEFANQASVTNLTYYQPDEIHLEEPGQELVAGVIQAAVIQAAYT